MRKQYLLWIIAVFGIVGVAYGGYLLIYHFNHGNGLSIPALLLLIFGGVALITFIVLYILSYISLQKKKAMELTKKEEAPVVEEVKPEPQPKAEVKSKARYEDVQYTSSREKPNRSIYDNAVSTIYIKKVGYGPILRIDGNRILDMRNNTYYRIEGNMVKQEGSGPLYEIRGNQIKNAFGGYLYELSGDNINKVFGGFYASISGNYITIYDLSVKYEMTDRLSKNQILAVAALLFGKY